MKIEKNKIRFYFYIGSVSTILILAILLSVIFTRSLNDEFNKKIEQLASSILAEKKKFLRNAVDRTIHLIEIERELVRKENAATSLNENQVEDLAKERIGKIIRSLRLIDDGYIWVNHIIDYEGGDNYAIRAIHPNLPETEGMMLSTNTLDTQGNRPYLEELNGIKENGELYFKYYFKKMNSSNISHKMSFAKLYKPYDWVIATGVYLDDLDSLIKAETAKMQGTLKEQKLYYFLVATIIFIISILILVIFEKQISKLISSYVENNERHMSEMHKEIAEHKKTEKERQQLTGELKQKNTELERFVYTISHDLKSPLVTIKAFTGILRQSLGESCDDSVVSSLNFIDSAAENMNQLLSDLLSFSRNGHLPLKQAPVCLNELAQQVVGELEVLLNEGQISCQISENLPQVLGDRSRLREVLQNLIENAIKYMGQQPEPKIEIGATTTDEGLACYVRDNGAGIPAEYQNKVFNLFERLSNDDKGTGVGLALVRQIVEQHGGKVWIESSGTPGKGTTFWFTLKWDEKTAET